MADMLSQIQERADTAQILLRIPGKHGEMSRCVTWVDDIALAIMAEAETVVQHTQTMLSIIMDVTIEHGMRMSYGQGKTAVILEFRGPKAVKARKACEARFPEGLMVLSEHDQPVAVPTVSHYKHLGGHVVRGGTKIPEIQIRAAAARQNVSPLKRILSDQAVPDEHKRILVKSLGLSVLRLHASTWFALNRGETDAWAAALFRTYQMLEGRKDGGIVQHKSLYQLAARMRAPMPVEFLHLEKLRLFVHLLHVFDTMAIAAVLHNFQIAGANSWLHSVLASLRWAQSQVGTFTLPDEVLGIVSWQGWDDMRDAVPHLRKVIKQVETAHLYRIRTYSDLKQHAEFQTALCQEMGWTFQGEEERSGSMTGAECEMCGKTFESQAALATHEHRVHGARMAMRRFATDGVCRACGKNFHTRCRLLRHLQWGGTKCWVFHARMFLPMSAEEAQEHDDRDRQQGAAMHQSHIDKVVVDKAWCWARPEEMEPHLQCVDFEGDPWEAPVSGEMEKWKAWGTLPPGQGGRPPTKREATDWQVHNAIHDISALEKQLKEDAVKWQPNYDWIPRPLVQDQKYFLIFFSGHRRWGDIASWLHWSGKVVPISIDIAVDSVAGDMLENKLWHRLIMARKVAGGHGGPPCETYSCARWNQIEGIACPQPLRDAADPWGRWGLTLKEVKQCYTGTLLMLTTLQLLFLIFAYGGSFTLEHPRGDIRDQRKWSIWQSSWVKWLMMHVQIQMVTFLQGPLGQAFAKPTVLLTARLPWLASMLFDHYDKGWVATETLEGREGSGWKTSRAKAYPEKLSKVIAHAHLRFLEDADFEGTELDPEGLQFALDKLARLHDPYDEHAVGTRMMADYHAKDI